MTSCGLCRWNADATAERSVRSSCARVSPCTSQPGAQHGADLTRYCPINPAAPVMIARGAMLALLLTGQLAIANSMRLFGFFAQPFLAVCFVIAVVPLEPDDFAVALERQDVCGDAIEKPAVVAADHGAAGEVLKTLFQGSQGVHIEIVRRLVEDDEVRAFFQHARKMDT